MTRWTALICVVSLPVMIRPAFAQTPTPLANTSQTTTLTATVSEQCHIAVPTGVGFNVTQVAERTIASPATVAIDHVVLATAAQQLRLSVRANSPTFTPPVGGAATWSASDVTWTAAAWANGSGSAGTLSDTDYHAVATSDPDVASISSTGLTFVLAPKATITGSGDHTLTLSWRVESFGF